MPQGRGWILHKGVFVVTAMMDFTLHAEKNASVSIETLRREILDRKSAIATSVLSDPALQSSS